MCSLHFNIRKEIGIKLHNEHCYDHVPKPVVTSREGKVTILKDQYVRTDRTIPNNKPHIIIRDNEKGKWRLTDVAISGDRNVITKEAKKILKYKYLITEIQRMWNVKAKVIAVIIGATGTISKSLRQYLCNIPWMHEIKELGGEKKHTGHCKCTMECNNVKVQIIFLCEITLHVATNCKYRTAATLYTPQKMVCFSYIILNCDKK